MCVWDKVIKPNGIRQEGRQITELNSQNGGWRGSLALQILEALMD